MTFENGAEFQVTPGTTGKNLKKSEERDLPEFTSYFKVTVYAAVLTSLMLHQGLISKISGSLSSELNLGDLFIKQGSFLSSPNLFKIKTNIILRHHYPLAQGIKI